MDNDFLTSYNEFTTRNNSIFNNILTIISNQQLTYNNYFSQISSQHQHPLHQQPLHQQPLYQAALPRQHIEQNFVPFTNQPRYRPFRSHYQSTNYPVSPIASSRLVNGTNPNLPQESYRRRVPIIANIILAQ